MGMPTVVTLVAFIVADTAVTAAAVTAAAVTHVVVVAVAVVVVVVVVVVAVIVVVPAIFFAVCKCLGQNEFGIGHPFLSPLP